MIRHQQEFTATEAQAICSMISILCNDDYEVRIYQGNAINALHGGEKYYPFLIQVKDTDGALISYGKGYLLIEALSDAFEQTPERTTT